MKTKKIYPAPGLVVRDPETMDPLPAKGLTVTMNKHWLRRIKCGDATTTKPRSSKGGKST